MKESSLSSSALKLFSDLASFGFLGSLFHKGITRLGKNSFRDLYEKQTPSLLKFAAGQSRHFARLVRAS